MRSTLLVVIALLTASTLATARTWHVPGDAPTIQGGIDLASAGDDVLVAPGVYPEHDIVMRSGVLVHSEAGHNETTVDATANGTGFTCSNLDQRATVEGFTIINGRASSGGQYGGSGGGVRCIGSSLLLRECVISGCSADYEGGGISAWGSDVELVLCIVSGCSAYEGGGIYTDYPSRVVITDCEIRGNEVSASSGGIEALGNEVIIIGCTISGNRANWGGSGGIGCISPALTIQDCVIRDNSCSVYGDGAGLSVGYSSGAIIGCTVAGNTGAPPPGGLYVFSSDLEIGRTLIAFNEGGGLGCAGSQVTVRCCDVFGNTGGDDLCGTDLGGNFSLDPLFCDAENGDYTLDGCSPCLPGNHPHGVDCGLIGALGQGCGATAVEETTWGRIKALYRR
jgi:hypothetical protein